jgi:hypothetical protein
MRDHLDGSKALMESTLLILIVYDHIYKRTARSVVVVLVGWACGLMVLRQLRFWCFRN